MAPAPGQPKNEKLNLKGSKVYKIKKDLYKKIILSGRTTLIQKEYMASKVTFLEERCAALSKQVKEKLKSNVFVEP